MIFVVDPVSRGIQHTPVNAAMLEIVRLAYPSRAIRFHAEAEHLAGVRTMMTPERRDSIEWSGVAIPPRNASLAKSLPMELLLLRRLLRQAQAAGSYVLVLSAFESTVFALKLLHLVMRCHVPVQEIGRAHV